MNNRIRELAEQASIDCELVEQWARDSAYIWTATDDELARFAELILRDCLDICGEYADCYGVAQSIATDIRSDFGIEEKNT